MKSLVPFAVIVIVGFILLESLTNAICPKPKFIDLTFSFNNETVFWGSRNISFATEHEGLTPGGFWMASRSFCTSEHTSTHIDAPYHFNKNGRKLHEIPFEDLLNVPGVMIGIFDKVNKIRDGKLVVRQNYVLTRQDIMEWEAKNGKIPQGAVVLLYTGWGMRWGDNNEYLGIAENATVDINEFPPTYTNYPGYDMSAAKFLAEERQIRGAGIDTISIDPGNTKEFWAHRIFTSRNIYMLEMVANLHVLPPRGFSLYMLPFKIDGGTASPTRVVAKLACKGRKGLPVNDNESVHEEEL